MRKGRVVITNEILEQGKSSNGGWSNKQMALLEVANHREKSFGKERKKVFAAKRRSLEKTGKIPTVFNVQGK